MGLNVCLSVCVCHTKCQRCPTGKSRVASARQSLYLMADRSRFSASLGLLGETHRGVRGIHTMRRPSLAPVSSSEHHEQHSSRSRMKMIGTLSAFCQLFHSHLGSGISSGPVCFISKTRGLERAKSKERRPCISCPLQLSIGLWIYIGFLESEQCRFNSTVES